MFKLNINLGDITEPDVQPAKENTSGYFLTFGKWKGYNIDEVVVYDPAYIIWLAKNCSFNKQLQDICVSYVRDYNLRDVSWISSPMELERILKG